MIFQTSILNAFFFIIFIVKGIFGISCRNEQNEDVDWFILYKFPKALEHPSDGSTYAYLTPSDLNSWKLSSISIKEENSMLGNTWKNLKSNEKDSTYLFYNDEPPAGFSGSVVGHLKGFLGFDGNSGFWLTHSIPKFGVISDYDYPETGLKYGQYAFCVTYNTSQLSKISDHLLYCSPNIYLHKASNKVVQDLTANTQTLFSDKPNFVHSLVGLRTSTLYSTGGLKIRSFAKDNEFSKDLYSGVIAPTLKTSLISETWRNGTGNPLPASCQKDVNVFDATSVKVKAVDRAGQTRNFRFNSKEDHSKWAVEKDDESNWMCFADLNRMKPYERCSGGALCFQSAFIWKQFRDSVTTTDTCPAT